MRAFPLELPADLPKTVAGRMEFISVMLNGWPVYDANGNPTGETTEPLISVDTAKRLMEAWWPQGS